ncbi:MAG: methyltransferase domain-containing protein [Lachnospiraceae bacterium]|nr:methyltransferase domain-containing protein [Lachnospiraceae bacterium]
METINSHKAVQEQYKTADNLNTRISIHAKYSTNKLGFGNWLFSYYDISPNIKILELGCGTGDIWKTNLHVLDAGVQLLLTDFSEGMISEVKKTFEACKNISYNIVNIENIPYENNRFDKVIANMMLYHVPDLHKGLSEVKRVLSDDGYFYCATYGENGIVPFIAGLLKEYGVKDITNKNFTLQNGYKILKKHFSDVKRLDYEDSLAVTDINDILDYLYSLTNITSIAELKRKDLKGILERKMVNGILNIPKEYGMFICRK